MEREEELEKLSKITGKPIQRIKIPDYIDPIFAKENNLEKEDHYISDDEKNDVVLFEEDKKKENEAKSDVTEIKLKRSNNKGKTSNINNKKKKK